MNKEELKEFCDNKINHIEELREHRIEALDRRYNFFKELSNKTNDRFDQWKDNFSDTMIKKIYTSAYNTCKDHLNINRCGRIKDISFDCNYITVNYANIVRSFYVQPFIKRGWKTDETGKQIYIYSFGFAFDDDKKDLYKAYSYDGDLSNLYITSEKHFRTIGSKMYDNLLELLEHLEKSNFPATKTEDAIECINYILENGEDMIYDLINNILSSVEETAQEDANIYDFGDEV